MNSLLRIVAGAFILSAPMGAVTMPLGFLENRGEAGPAVRYIAAGPESKAWFRPDGVVLQRGGASAAIVFAGAARDIHIEALEPTLAAVHFLRGYDPPRTGLPLYRVLRYDQVWPGIDIVYRGEGGKLEAEYHIAAHSSVARIAFRFDGAAQVARDGSLKIRTRSGDIVEPAPTLYQQGRAGERIRVPGRFRLIDRHTAGFEAASYDHSKPLVIDPPFLFSGYFGGSAQQQITAMVTTPANQVIAAGWTSSTDFPALNPIQAGNGGGVDAFIAVFNDTGELVSCTYLGGSGDDRAFGLAVDRQLNIYVTGWTSSRDFPLKGGVQRALGGTRDAFVAKLDPSGANLIYSTYLGGAGVDSGAAIAVDSAGSAIVAGQTASANYPVSSNAFQVRLAGAQNAFVTRLNAAGNAILESTYFGGAGSEIATAVQVDSVGYTYLGGSTTSTNLPVASPTQAHSGGGQDGFVAALAPDLSAPVFSTYLGGSSGSAGAPEQVNGLALDPAGNVIVAGTTSSSDFPVTAGAYQTIFGGQTDGFLAKFSSAGAMIACTLLGGSQTDGINALALDFHGYPYVTGYTGSTDFPAQRAIQSANAGQMDAFAAKLNGSLTGLIFSTYFGGSLNEAGNAIAVDSHTGIAIAGATTSIDLPASGSLSQTIKGSASAFLAKVAPHFGLGFVISPYFFLDVWHGSGFSGLTETDTMISFGSPGDIPISGDWDGSGVKRIGSFRNGAWYLDINGDGIFDAGDKTISFGQSGDLPIVGDWDGTGRVKLGLWRSGTFILDLSGHLTGVPTGNADATFPFGQPGDFPVAGDWNGSGTAKVGVFRSGKWLVDYNGDHLFNASDQTWTYGQAGDLPVTGNWDGSGATNIGVYRDGLWILDYDGDRQMTSLGSNELVLGYGGLSLLFTPLVW